MIFLIFQILLESTNACQNVCQGVCLTDINSEIKTINIASSFGFRYGFWSKYLSMASNYESNLAIFNDQQVGYTVFRQIDPQTSQTLLLLYQNWHYQDADQQKHLKFGIFENDVFKILAEPQFEASQYEGMWIYYSIAYVSINEIQFNYYTETSFFEQILPISYQINSEIQINLGGKFSVKFIELQKFTQEGNFFPLAEFLGQLSTLNFQQPSTKLSTNIEFLSYLNNLGMPNICELQVFETKKIPSLQYQSGEIFMESWIKLDVQSQLNISVSVLGIEFPIKQGKQITYQKILDIHYMIWQAWIGDMANAIYLFMLEKNSLDYIQLITQFIGNTAVDHFLIVNQNLQEWHFVQVYYGFDFQQMKVWSQDGSSQELIFHNQIYRFEDRQLIVRAGSLFEISQPGVYVNTGLSKIYVCQPEVNFQKTCHYSCLDCDGPESNYCLSCPQDRYFDNRQCKCNLGYLENSDGICKGFANLYPNSEFQFEMSSFSFFQFGYFPVTHQGTQFFLKCPKYERDSKTIYCIDCLSNPEAFSETSICTTDYILNDYGQYELQVRKTKDFEFYMIDNLLQEMRLCVGCLKTSYQKIDDTYFFNTEVLKYIKCLDGYYQDVQKCMPCSSDCNKCQNLEICNECEGIKVLNKITGKCLSCLSNCEKCSLDHLNNVICIQCAEKFSLYQGNCMACGQYCKTCEYMLDKYTNQYYNRCIVCLDSSKYYLKLSAVDCGVNKIDQCYHVIEFHHNKQVQEYDNTMWHLYNKRDYNQNDIVTYCAWCSPAGTTSLLSGQCLIYPEGYQTGIDGNRCIAAFQIIENGQIVLKCAAYSIENQVEEKFNLYSYCHGLIENCNSCYNSYCVSCFSGFYAELFEGQCYECPSSCYKCQQQSKYHKNGWKIKYRFTYGNYRSGMFYPIVFGDEQGDQLEVVCTACNPGYELYKEQCIPECAINCKTCIKLNGQNYCVECHSYDGKVLSLYQGKCIECPRYCSLCYPKSNELISSTNPYFSYKEKFVSATYTCLLLEAGLDQEQYIYNIGLKQFLKYNSQQVDPNKVQIQYNVYCDSVKFYQDLEIQSDKQMFLSQNVRIDEILSQDSTQTNFNRFENDQLYQYLGTQQIQLVEFHYLLLQDCTIKQTSYLFTTLTKNVYAINQASVFLDGNFHHVFLEENLEIQGFEEINLKNINMNFAKGTTHINLQSLKTLDVTMMNVNITSQTNTFPFQLTRIKTLTIEQFTILDSNFQDVASIFKLIDQNEQLTLNLTNFKITESNFENTNLLSINKESSKITVIMQSFQVMGCVLKKSAFIASIFPYYLTISGLIIQGSTFFNCSKLFMTDLAITYTLDGSSIAVSQFYNTAIFQLSLESKIDEFEFLDCILQNSSSFTQSATFSNQFKIQLQNFFISNITYDTQSSLLYASTTVEYSQIKLSNWTLKFVQLSSNSIINADSLSYLIFIQATTILLEQINLSRQSGMTEFYLGQATTITISNLKIENGNLIKSLITNPECSADFSFSRYLTALQIEKSQFIYINEVSITNVVVFDVPVIVINSIESQFVRRSESIIVSNFIITNCIIQKHQTTNQFSLIQVISEQKISINLLNGTFNYNFYHSQDAESETNSALAMYLFIENGNFSMDGCTFQNNYVSQSKNSLMAVFASNVLISNSNFTSNNYFVKQFIKHIDWGYKPSKLSKSQLTNYFPVQSLSGNGKFQSNNVTIFNVNIKWGTATKGGCFQIALNNDGVLNALNSNFQNISVSTEGGCFYIIDKATSITINLENTVFDTIFSVSEGGAIYFSPLSQSIKFNLKSLQIIDVFSLSGAFLSIHFFNSLSQLLYVSDCKIISTPQGLGNFIQKLGSMNEIQKTQLIENTAVFVVQQGVLNLQNIVSNLYIIALLEATFQSKVSLTSVIIENSYFSKKSAIMIGLNQDETCKVSMNRLEVSKYKFYNETSNISIQIDTDEYLSLSSSCQNNLIFGETELQQKIINMSLFGIHEIPQLFLISGIKSNDQISLKKCSFSQNVCSSCQSGLLQLSFNEEISNSANFQFQKAQVFENDCGQNGCMNFLRTSQYRLLSQTEYQITINSLICSNNKAVNGACIYSQGVGLLISQSIINTNNATNLGGGVYYSGDVKNLLLYNNLISNNNAGSGSALYVEGSSSPELNKTNNFISSTTQTIQSSPTSLSVTLNNYQNMLYNYRTDMSLGFLTKTQDSMDQVILTLPSGQQINTYQFFNTTSQEYLPLNITFRIVPLNDYFERQKNLISTSCKITSGYLEKQTIVITNNYTNIDSKEFDSKTQDYNFDDLIIYYGANNTKGHLILLFYCNSVKIPIYESVFPYQIINYISNYSLQVTIQTFDCQLGEYKDLLDDSCHLCDINKKQYSVKYGARSCNFMDEDTIMQITPAQLKLKNGYWRLDLYNEIIEKCKNKINNCLGGWKQGDETCLTGQLGARCESCDSYNIRGSGQYSQKQLYTCGLCEDLGKQILYIIATSIWTIISINLTTKGIENMIMEIQKNRVGKIQLIINANKQTGPYIKMFTNYLQNIAIILNFNVDIPNNLKLYFNILGNPQQQLLISTDCFVVSQISENIMYVKIIQTLINPIVYGLIYLFIYFILVKLNKVQFNKIVITTTILYLFFYFQPQAMQLLIASLSYQTISGIEWVQANLAYQFYTTQHQQWLPYFIVLIILVGFLFPASLLMSLISQRKEIYANQLRRNWGYLILEYQPSAYYWEFARILTRELIIITITFYQDNIILKCVLVFFVIIVYQQGTTAIQPFKTTALNQLDIKTSQVCLITILSILSLTQSMKQYNLVLLFLIFPNSLLFVAFLAQLFISYIQEYEELLDKARDFIRSKMAQTDKSVFITSLIQNRQERRKIVMQRFKLIKKYLYSKTKKAKTYQSFKFITETDSAKEKPYETLFTKSDSKSGSKAIFLFRN